MRLLLLFILITIVLFVPLSHGEMYKWVDEKGTVHFTDDPSKIPEKYRPDAETRKPGKETSAPKTQELPKSSSPSKESDPEGITVELARKGELLFTEVILNGSIRKYFIVDTGASFTLINRITAKELGIRDDESTPYIRAASVSGIISVPLVTLGSVRVGNAEVENVETVIYPMAASGDGLLGNSFLNKFKVVINANQGMMTLYPMRGIPSPEFPGGYSKDYWVGQFRFYHRNLEELRSQKAKLEKQSIMGELVRVNNAIRYFENQLSELERKASFAGVPRNWRQ